MALRQEEEDRSRAFRGRATAPNRRPRLEGLPIRGCARGLRPCRSRISPEPVRPLLQKRTTFRICIASTIAATTAAPARLPLASASHTLSDRRHFSVTNFAPSRVTHVKTAAPCTLGPQPTARRVSTASRHNHQKPPSPFAHSMALIRPKSVPNARSTVDEYHPLNSLSIASVRFYAFA